MRLISYICFIYLSFTSAILAETPEPLAEISIQLVNNRVVIEVPAGQYNVHLVLDTGATKTALFQSEDLDFSAMKSAGKAEIMFPALDEKVTGTRLKPFTIKIGKEDFSPQKPLLIHKRPPIGDRLNFAFDGVLGQDFFTKYVVEVDPDEELLRLYPAGIDISHNYSDHLKLQMRGSTPYIDFFHPLPWERTHLRPRDPKNRKSMLFDTGYPGVMVFWKEEHLKKIVSDKRVEELRASNTGIFTRASIRLGKVKFHRVPIFLAPKAPKQISDRDGIIGSNLIYRFKYAIDFTGERILLDRGKYKIKTIDGAFYVPNNEQYIYKLFNTEKKFQTTVAETEENK